MHQPEKPRRENLRQIWAWAQWEVGKIVGGGAVAWSAFSHWQQRIDDASTPLLAGCDPMMDWLATTGFMTFFTSIALWGIGGLLGERHDPQQRPRGKDFDL